MPPTAEDASGDPRQAGTLIGPDRPDRWTDQIRHIDTYQTRPDEARGRPLSDPCGEQGDGQVSAQPSKHGGGVWLRVGSGGLFFYGKNKWCFLNLSAHDQTIELLCPIIASPFSPTMPHFNWLV